MMMGVGGMASSQKAAEGARRGWRLAVVRRGWVQDMAKGRMQGGRKEQGGGEGRVIDLKRHPRRVRSGVDQWKERALRSSCAVMDRSEAERGVSHNEDGGGDEGQRGGEGTGAWIGDMQEAMMKPRSQRLVSLAL